MWWTADRQRGIGLGAMRLSTDPARQDDRSLAVLQAAFEAGITVVDTADAYALDDSEIGHNERLIARALAAWPGNRHTIRLATKGGLTRPGGRWVPDGRATHLTAACEASCRALGVNAIDLYQLHAPDPRTSLATSVRALAALQRAGLIRHIGLCNITASQLDEATKIVHVDAVQVELSPWHDDNVLNGVIGLCLEREIAVLAHRPLGGPARQPRLRKDPVLGAVAARHRASAAEIALAWLRDLSPAILPLPGVTRVETARSTAAAASIALTGDDRRQLDERFTHRSSLQAASAPAVPLRTDGEIVLVMGLPAAGKSTLARSFVERGYQRLNRDAAGGTLASLLPALDAALDREAPHIVLDNTYATRKARAQVIQAARLRGLGVRCLHLATSLEDAQINAVSRTIARYGRLLTPDEIRVQSRADPGVFGPGVQHRYQRTLEPPDVSEGFSSIDRVEFERTRETVDANRAVIVWCDGVVLRSRSGRRTPASADDVEVPDECRTALAGYASAGWRLLGLSWQPDVAEGTRSAAEVDAILARGRQRLGLPMEIVYCPHAAGPPICWCRKPLPGLGVLLIEQHQLDPAACLYVGSGAQDPGFARRLGWNYREAQTFFAAG